ncbi:MAG: hypothetical protein Q9196_000045 [Gyalolechia fulgens]
MLWYTAAAGRWIPVHLPSITSIRLASTLPVLQEATFFASIGWILYRIWQIWQKPVDELVDLLGLDIPSVPDVSLAGITSESVLLYWKPADNQSASLKNTIQVNGIKAVGDFGVKDTSIQVTGLKPGHYYNVRVIVTNSANFSTVGPLIRIRTVPVSDTDSRGSSKAEADNSLDERIDGCEPAGIRAGRSQSGSLSNAPVLPAAKEPPSAQTASKRVMLGRRISPVRSPVETPSLLSSRATSVHEGGSEETIQALTEQLDRLQREQHETDKQVDDDDREHLVSVADLSKERDHLRQALKEKEESIAELKKHGNQLEKTNRAAQNRKSNQEKVLAQKQNERDKIKKDIDRWDHDIALMRQESDQVALEKVKFESTKGGDLAAIRELIAEDHSLIKVLEDEIKITGVQIKSMEKDRGHANGDGDDGRHDTNGKTDEDYSWEARVQSIQAQLAALWHTLQQVEAENQQAQDRVNYWTSRRLRDPSHFAALPTLDYPSANRLGRPRRQRQVANRVNTASFPQSGYHTGPLSVPYNPSNASSHFPSVSPFFNMSNGMTLQEAANLSIPEHLSQSYNDSDILTSSEAMSPAANDLLPSNLFRDEDIMVHESPTTVHEDPFGRGVSDLIEARSNPPLDNVNVERRTPGSADSRRGSLLSSPHGSIRNRHSGQSSVDAFVDSERLSTNSTSASAMHGSARVNNPLITSRLAQLFPPFNRQRGKSSTREAPALGTLKQGQSQSFPRNLDQESVSSVDTRHRRGSYGSWALPMAGLLNRNGIDTDEVSKNASSMNLQSAPAPKSRPNIFGAKADTEGASVFRERSSSRPSSMYSFEQIHGRPSSDSQRVSGWPVAEGTPSRGSPLNVNWSTLGGPWSHGPSRRPSVQHGSASNLSIGSTPLDSETYDDALALQRSEQLPIGTRPRSSQRFSTPKLNPAAPTFKTIFGRSDARRAARAEKANERAAEKERLKEAGKTDVDENAIEGDESSLSQPRLSKDAGSITTAVSAADSRDSLDRSTSAGTSEAAASSGTRESFMQKITRKSSSGKFNITWGKERGGIFFKKTGEPSTPDEIEEDVSNEGYFAKGRDSLINTPQQEKGTRSSLSWPNMRRKSKKGGLMVEKAVDTADDDDT